MNILVCMPQGAVKDTFFNKYNIDLLAKHGNVFYNPNTTNFTQEEYKEQIKDKDIVITGWGSPKTDLDVLENANKLKLVVHMAGSVAPFLCPEVYERGIKVISGNEVIAQSVAEGVIAYILAHNREITRFNGDFKEKGLWKPKTFNTLSLIGKTVGIVSYGSIAKYLVRMLQGFDVKILVYSRSLAQEELDKYNMTLVTLDEIFEQSDIISIHTALNEHTINMINKKHFDKMKDNSIFINTARSQIVNEEDLINALNENRFSAILDVFNKEPLPEDNPYRKMDNVFMMPHMVGPTNEARSLLCMTTINEMNKVLNNEYSIHEVKMEKFKNMTK